MNNLSNRTIVVVGTIFFVILSIIYLLNTYLMREMARGDTRGSFSSPSQGDIQKAEVKRGGVQLFDPTPSRRQEEVIPLPVVKKGAGPRREVAGESPLSGKSDRADMILIQ